MVNFQLIHYYPYILWRFFAHWKVYYPYKFEEDRRSNKGWQVSLDGLRVTIAQLVGNRSNPLKYQLDLDEVDRQIHWEEKGWNDHENNQLNKVVN